MRDLALAETRVALVHGSRLRFCPGRCPGCDGINWLRGKTPMAADSQASRVVVANVYNGRRWERVEYWHLDCYQLAGEPLGTTEGLKMRRARARKGYLRDR